MELTLFNTATQRAKADYCHDPVRSQVIMLYGLRSLEVAAWLLVLFRFYARWVTQRFFGWDDYTMMVVAVIYIPQLIISQLMDDNAFGRDIWNLEWSKIMLGLKLFFVQEPLYLLQLGLTKISILFLYLRIFPGRRFKIITYTFMAFVAGSTLTLVGGSVVECLPVGYFWNAWNTEYLIHTTKCVNLTVAVFAAAGLSILQDIIMIILPIPPLLKTQLPKKNKIGIATMFILGLLITGASCFRLQYVNVAYSPDPFWDFEPALLWSLVELAMSFLVTSLPALRNYYTKIIRPKDKRMLATMNKDDRVIIVGAGVFGLSTAAQLASEGFKHVVVVDRHTPPVPDGSSSDISRVIRFDYADEDYSNLAYDAYLKWSQESKYNGIFYPASFVLTGSMTGGDKSWIDKTTTQLNRKGLPWTKLDDAASAKQAFPILTGNLAEPNFKGYFNEAAGWADANKAITLLRNECLERGVSFLAGAAGTVVKFNTDSAKTIISAQALDGTSITGDHFILAAGAWSSNLVSMYNSTLATAQVVGYTPLSDAEVQKYKEVPIYANFNTGWFNFPPHEGTKTLKMAVHGWGYTRAPSDGESAVKTNTSTPRLHPSRERPDFCPAEGEKRLRDGLREILPELADRTFERVTMCWYTDTPSGDFIMDYHPDFTNLFVGGAGSGHAFKFLPVLGEYMSMALKKSLPRNLADKWRFRTEYENRTDVFLGDGSRGGPARRELTGPERSRLDGREKAQL
ncbi:sarcosine oxidase [Colletotrichum karsti]|uniref:Sarcosine oxidase n=1 Tax=Colletotrichum karsti TaxID=1095194 RepID=A0A9P6HVZ0_9PEZI|nr:sarcosine oxidase [Colletotrichum karsti]KAF9869891.1 sarcosine oxidase [Colletotrichum karsti]